MIGLLRLGVVTFIHTMDSIDSILAKADELMYQVKTSGKNMVRQEVFR